MCLSVCLPVRFCFNRGDDTTGEARLRSDWNKHVMKDVIAPLYALLLAKACTYLQTLPEISSSSVLSLIQTYEGDAHSIKSKKNEENNMPNTNTEEHSSQYSSSVECFTVESSSPYSILSLFPCPVPSDCWGSVPRHLFPLLADQRILFSRSSGGSYLSLRQAILLESRTNISTFLSVHSTMNSSSLSSSTFSAIRDSNSVGIIKQGDVDKNHYCESDSNVQNHQSKHTQSNRTYSGSSSTERLEKLLLLEGLPVAVVPSEVYTALLSSGCVRDRVTPSFVRACFSVSAGEARNHPAVTASASQDRTGKENSNGNDKAKMRMEVNESNKETLTLTVGLMSKEEALSNALFLLQYALKDISGDIRLIKRNSADGKDGVRDGVRTGVREGVRDGVRDRDGDGDGDENRGNDIQHFTSLHGLCILPMEDGTLGVIQESTGSPLYLVSNVERRLLQRAGGSLIVPDNQLGPAVCAILRDRTFSQYCNVRTLTPIDTLKVLRTFLPKNWFDSSVSTVINRESTVTDEWLGWLWSYILEEKSIDLFEGVFPLLPVLPPASLIPGNYLVKISPLVPVLHMSFSDLPADASDVLSKLGIYTLDSTVIGGSAYSNDISRLVSEASPKGLLNAICVVSERENYIRTILAWSADKKKAMRDLLLDRVVAKIDMSQLTEREKEVLFTIPVFERHRGGAISLRNTVSDPTFGPIHSLQTLGSEILDLDSCMQIPPKEVDTSLLGFEFLVLRSELDRILYSKLGLSEPTKG